VGLVFTYPLSLLALSHVLAQWDRIATDPIGTSA
jgi:hypothetical protein